jgi:gamma-glutamylputrescine oxidase
LTDPLWVAPTDSRYPDLPGTVEADIAIIGGGLSGVGAAYALRDMGADVVLLEERTLASGASGRNAGFVLAGPAMPFGQACDLLGFEEACALWRFTVENNRLMADLIEEYAIECDYLRRGSMSLAVSDDEMDLLVATSNRMVEAGLNACTVARRDLPRPLDRLYVGGIYYPGNGEINPGAFLRGLASAVSDTLRIFERSHVHEIRVGDPHVLVTSKGEVRARTVIVATNAYTTRLLPAVPIAPVRGQVVATRSLGRVIVPFPMYANYGYQYWRQTSDGRLVVGGWRDLDMPAEVGTDERSHDVIQDSLEGFCRVIGGADVVIEYRWCGIMGFTPDALPLVGAVPGHVGLYLAAGYSGHGVSMAFSCGARVALQAIERTSDVPSSLNPGRYLDASYPSTLRVASSI